jgi:hypothetical protein
MLKNKKLVSKYILLNLLSLNLLSILYCRPMNKTRNDTGKELVRVHALFFKQTHHKQRATLRLLIWWSIKYYFKILFKK